MGEKNRKGLLETNHKHIFVPGKSVNFKLGTKHTSEKYKNKKCGKTASQQISECQKDHFAFQGFLRVGSTIDFTHAANQQPGMTVFLLQFQVFLVKGIDSINHGLHQFYLGVSQTMFVGNIIGDSSLSSRFTTGSSGLYIELFASCLQCWEAFLGPSR